MATRPEGRALRLLRRLDRRRSGRSELAPKYAPELNIVGTAIGGVPVHLAHNLRYINGTDSWSGVIPAVLVSLGRGVRPRG